MTAIIDGELVSAEQGQRRTPWPARAHTDLPPLRGFVGDCLVQADDQTLCIQPNTQMVVHPPTVDIVMYGSEVLMRLASGPVRHIKHGRAHTIDLPPANLSSGGLVLMFEHACALVDGRVACWGSDAANGRGDGGGRNLRWNTPKSGVERLEKRLPCAVEERVLTCRSDWAGDAAAAHVPVKVTDVEAFAAGEELACGLRANRELVCVGFDGAEILPPRVVATDVIAFDVGTFASFLALRSDGSVIGNPYALGRFVEVLQLEGAVDVHLGGGVGCVRSSTQFLCLTEDGLASAPLPRGELVRDSDSNLCDTETKLCIDQISDSVLSTDVTWVEAGW